MMEGKTRLRANAKVKNKKDKFTLSEAQLGYLMIAPAILIIIVIAFYPVLRSFWYSLFDLRLNNPTKNTVNLSYKFDMERYFSNYNLAKGALKQASNGEENNTAAKINDAVDKLQNINIQVEKQNDILAKEPKVKIYTDKFQTVPDDKIKFASIDKGTAQSFLTGIDNLIKEISSITVSKDSKDYIDKAAGLMQELRDSIIKPNFVGVSNYSYFIKDDRFWGSLGYTFRFTFYSVAIELVLGMLIAVLINRNFKGRGIVRTAVLVPWAIPTVVSALMWKFLYDGQNGFMAHVFAKLHIVKNAGVLLTTHNGATFSTVFADVWKTTPYMALLLLAGLQGIDSTLYEAADVDGATTIQQFFRITLPLLKPTILVALLFRTLDAFRIFDLISVLTGGANSTETISVYAYKTMFAQMEFGKGSTLSVVVFICVALISIGYVKILGADVLSSDSRD